MEKQGRGIVLGWLIPGIFVALAIAVIIAIALPGLIPSEIAANETIAVRNLRAISSSQQSYRAKYGSYGAMAQLADEGDLDGEIARATSPERANRGYCFRPTVGEDGWSWSCVAMPAEPGVTGARSFYTDETGIIRYRSCESTQDPPADGTSPEIENW